MDPTKAFPMLDELGIVAWGHTDREGSHVCVSCGELYARLGTMGLRLDFDRVWIQLGREKPKTHGALWAFDVEMVLQELLRGAE